MPTLPSSTPATVARTPRYLLGAALAFWGFMTERLVPGLACLLVVEAAHWTSIRWDFRERAFLNAWRLCVLLLLVTMILVVMDGARFSAMPRVFTWLPVIFLPLQFVQSYGLSHHTSLSVFSLMVRRRREHAEKYGLPFRDIRFGFGNAYLCGILLASALGERSEHPAFYPILVLLAAWGLVAASGRAWREVGLATFLAVVLSAALGTGGQVGLWKLYRHLTQQRGQSGESSLEYARERLTQLGRMGPLKQSTDIQWRLIPESGPLPRYLRIAAYNTYLEQSWQADVLPPDVRSDSDGFEAVAQITNPRNPDDPEDSFYIAPPNLPDPQVAVAEDLAHFRLRGATPATRGFSLLPFPADAAAFHEFDPEELERNPFGIFRHKPSQPIADIRVLRSPDFATELPPWRSSASAFDRRRFDLPHGPLPKNAKLRYQVDPELQIPPSERDIIARVSADIGLDGQPLKRRIALLRQYFQKNFTYSRYNRVPHRFDPARHGTLLGKFLEHNRSGHCEFYATATALLLRQGGTPTRYATGFVAVETDPSSRHVIIRGTHAHAWCRAWDAESSRWIDVDLTPPDWLGLEQVPPKRFQAVSDWFQQVREDLLVWRDRPGRMMWLTLGLLSPILVGLAYIGRNLWRSRSRIGTKGRRTESGARVIATPLHELERTARRHLGPRPPGQPFGLWLLRLAPKLDEPELLQEAVSLHQAMRFDTPSAEGEVRLRQLSRELRGQLRRAES